MGKTSNKGVGAKFGNRRPSTSRLIAKDRGIHEVRRPIALHSRLLLADAYENGLSDEIYGSGRLFLPKTLGVTVVGFTRYTRRCIERAPATHAIIDDTEHGNSSIPARLGGLVMMGHEKKPNKLAITLDSDDLSEEIDEYSSKFIELGLPLKPDFNADTPDGSPVPHLTIGLVGSGRIAHFSDRRFLSRLDGVLGLAGTEIQLLPPTRFDASHTATM